MTHITQVITLEAALHYGAGKFLIEAQDPRYFIPDWDAYAKGVAEYKKGLVYANADVARAAGQIK